MKDRQPGYGTKRRLYRLLWLPLVLASMQVQASDWFNLYPENERYWKLVRGNDASQLTILPRSTGTSTPFQVAVLFSKKSSAYDIAMNQLLREFENSSVSTDFLLVNYEGNEQKGLNFLENVRRNGWSRYDLFLSMGSGTTEFLYRNIKGRPIPVVTICSKDPVLMGQMDNYMRGSGNNFAFTSLDIPINIHLKYMRKLRPQLKRIVILYARNNKSARITQVQPLLNLADKEGIEVIEVVVEDASRAGSEIVEKLKKAVQYVFAKDATARESVIWITGSTSVFNEMATINQLAQKIPVLSVTPSLVTGNDDSALMSIGVSFKSNAQLAFQYVLPVLEKKDDPGNLSVGQLFPPDIAIDFSKARRNGIKIPFSFFETASTIFDYDGRKVKEHGRKLN